MEGRVGFVLCFWGSVHFAFFSETCGCLFEGRTEIFRHEGRNVCEILLGFIFKEKLMETPFFLAGLLV